MDADDAKILEIAFTMMDDVGIGRGDGSGGGISRKVSIAAAAPTVVEGSPAVFVLTASETSSATLIYVGLSTTGNFEVSARTRTVEIADGETTATLTIDTVGDNSVEAWGTVTATVGCATHSLVGMPDTAPVTIADDDVTISVTATTATVSEGSAAVFVLTADEAPPTTFTVKVELSATGAYEVATGTRTVEFEAGATTATFRVETRDDNVDEENGTATAVLQAGTGYAIRSPVSLSTVTVVIVDDDVTISITAKTLTVSEGSAAVFVLTASKAPRTGVVVRVEVSSTGAYEVAVGTRAAEFEAGAIAVTLTVHTLGNDSVEAWGTVMATVGRAPGYLVGTTDTASVTLADDDVTMSIAAHAPTVATGSAAVFVLTASEAPQTAFTVEVALSGWRAFAAATGTRTVEFEAGATTATLSVNASVYVNSFDEIDASGGVTTTLQTGFGYELGASSTAVVTISDEDQE